MRAAYDRPSPHHDPTGQFAAEWHRIGRLFAVLDDVADYAGPRAGQRMLSQAWARIEYLLLGQADSAEFNYLPALLGDDRSDPAVVASLLAGLTELRHAVGHVRAQRTGGPGWWQAVLEVARLSAAQEEAYAGLAGSSPTDHAAGTG